MPILARRSLPRPAVVGLAVLGAYAAWLIVAFAAGMTALTFVHEGKTFTLESHASRSIHYYPAEADKFDRNGYDGQFYYFLAVDPVHARYYMRNDPGGGAAYRYQRILYPMLARVLALGRTSWIPWTMILINWLAVASATAFIAAWLLCHAKSPWLAVIYALYPGLVMAVQMDLTEPLSYAFVAAAIYVVECTTRRVWWAALALCLAVLTRETSALFVPFVLWMLATRRWRAGGTPRIRAFWEGAGFVAISLLPFLSYKAFLYYWLGGLGGGQSNPVVIPFQGLIAHWPWGGGFFLALVCIIVPAGFAAWACLQALRRVPSSPYGWMLAAALLVFVALLPETTWSGYLHLARQSIAVVLAGLLCVPLIDRVTSRRTWLWPAVVCWYLTLPVLLIP